MGGTRYSIPREEWYVRSAEDGKCVIKIMHSPVKDKWALGLNFMTSYYTVFDYENQRVGLALSKKAGRAHSTKFTKWAFAGEAKQKLMNLASAVHENLNPFEVSFRFYWGMVALSFVSAIGVVLGKRVKMTPEEEKIKAVEVSESEIQDNTEVAEM